MDAANVSDVDKIMQHKQELHNKLKLLKEKYDLESKGIWKELARLNTEGKDICKITHNGCNLIPDGNYAYSDLVCTRCGTIRYR
tara:strand:- start:152 stop:403 length:252 start_codon:yes stop_codon:yes gene_type:complete